MKEEKFPSTRKRSYGGSVGSFGISEGNITGRKKRNPQIMRLTTTPSREVASMLASTSSKQGLKREVQAALLKERTGPECPEDNLRDLT